MFDELMIVAGLCTGGVCNDRHDVFYHEDIDKLLDEVIKATWEKFEDKVPAKQLKSKFKKRKKIQP